MTWSYQNGLGWVKHTSFFVTFADWPEPGLLDFARRLVAAHSDTFYFKWEYHEGNGRWHRAVYQRWFTDNAFPIRTFWSKRRVVLHSPQEVAIAAGSGGRELIIRFSRIPVLTEWWKERYQLTPGRMAQQILEETESTWEEW